MLKTRFIGRAKNKENFVNYLVDDYAVIGAVEKLILMNYDPNTPLKVQVEDISAEAIVTRLKTKILNSQVKISLDISDENEDPMSIRSFTFVNIYLGSDDQLGDFQVTNDFTKSWLVFISILKLNDEDREAVKSYTVINIKKIYRFFNVKPNIVHMMFLGQDITGYDEAYFKLIPAGMVFNEDMFKLKRKFLIGRCVFHKMKLEHNKTLPKKVVEGNEYEEDLEFSDSMKTIMKTKSVIFKINFKDKVTDAAIESRGNLVSDGSIGGD